MADLGTIANYAEIFGAVTVIGGLLFAGLQLRQFRQQREDAASLTILNTFLKGSKIVADVRLITGLGADEIIANIDHDPELRAAVDNVNVVSETLGFMVYQNSVSLSHVAEVIGNAMVACWQVMKPLAEKERAEMGRSGPYDWQQWLVEQLERHAAMDADVAAYVKHRDWKPPR